MDEGERRLLHGYAGADGGLSGVKQSRLLSSAPRSVSGYCPT